MHLRTRTVLRREAPCPFGKPGIPQPSERGYERKEQMAAFAGCLLRGARSASETRGLCLGLRGGSHREANRDESPRRLGRELQVERVVSVDSRATSSLGRCSLEIYEKREQLLGDHRKWYHGRGGGHDGRRSPSTKEPGP